MASACLLSAVLLGLIGQGGNPKTVLVLPLETDNGLSDLGLGMSLQVQGILRAYGGLGLVHPKLLSAVEDRHEHRLRTLAPAARRRVLARILGADHVVFGKVYGDPLRVELRLEGPAGAREASATGGGFGAVVDALPAAVGELAASLVTGKPPGPLQYAPYTRTKQAVIDHAACHRELMRQPFGIGQPVVVDELRLRIAMDDCLAAAERDDRFAGVRADLALGFALIDDRKSAERLLTELKDDPAFHPSYWLARFLVLARYYDPELALENLETAIEKDPGFSLGRGYLGESLLALGRPSEALAVFEAYRERAPSSAWVLARIGQSITAAGRPAQGLAWTEKALELTPADPDLRLEYARQLAASGRRAAAIQALETLAAEPGAAASVLTTLGEQLASVGRRAEAEQALRAAIARADRQTGWRARNEARYALARLSAELGAPEEAIRLVRHGLLEGFLDRTQLSAPPLAPLMRTPSALRLQRVEPLPGATPRLMSPLGRVSESGQLLPRTPFERRTDRKVLERI